MEGAGHLQDEASGCLCSKEGGDGGSTGLLDKGWSSPVGPEDPLPRS